MGSAPHETRSRYLVELPDTGLDVRELTERTRSLALDDARFLRTVYVPEDGRLFLLLEAASPDAALAGAHELGCVDAAVTPVIRAAPRP